MILKSARICFIDESEVITFYEIAPSDKYYYIEIIFKNGNKIQVPYERFNRSLLVEDLERIGEEYGKSI